MRAYRRYRSGVVVGQLSISKTEPHWRIRQEKQTWITGLAAPVGSLVSYIGMGAGQ
jgi:hypothetical protein